jgi:Ala-tRNA(Pro) deacylase
MYIGEYLVEQRIDFECLPHAPAYTAQKRAKYLSVPGKQVAKSVLLVGPMGPLLAVLPATHQVDTRALSEQLGGPVRLATDSEITQTFPDCEWGVVPPFGGRYGIATLLEQTIDPETQIVLETHSQFQSVRMRCRDYERLEQPRRLRFARLPRKAASRR